jgi:hypothetical protein
VLASGVRVRVPVGFDRQTLRELLSLLEQPASAAERAIAARLKPASSPRLVDRLEVVAVPDFCV